MALRACEECGKQISTKAKACPHCGAVGSGSNLLGIGCAVVALGWIVAILAFCSNLPPRPTRSSQDEACDANWTKCANNSQLMNTETVPDDIRRKCQEAAEEKSKYGSPQWPQLPFGSFYDGRDYIDTGVAIALEKRASFPNVFGVQVKSSVVCRYDLRTRGVLDIVISER